ncbi:MAG: asparagine synthase C-terminal domain-containing protein, partial [Bacteroidales bacterium]|nr:asparagine synthase C-terminal domain-containing protein [Bacteroidales bacterium]
FYDSVKIRLRADVEVAAYLSGGIDSSVTTSYIKRIEPKVLNTFSIGFSDEVFDETQYQLEAAKYLDTDHYYVKCSSLDIANNFPKVIWHSECPTIRTAPAPMYQLSKLVRDNDIKVVITGEGADEMLAGYNIFKETEIRRFWAKDPQSKYRPLLLKRLYPYLPQMQNANATMLKLFFGKRLNETDNPFYSHLLRWSNGMHITKHMQQELLSSMNAYNPFDELESLLPNGFNTRNSLSKSQWLETSLFMSGYLLSTQGDRMAMGNSVEGRYPFLDHRLIEFCASLPSNFKLNGLTEKYILKKLIKGKIPDQILNRSKQAYRAPISKAFLGNKAPSYVKDLLSTEKLKHSGIFNENTVPKLIEKIKKSDHVSEVENMAIAAILSTQLLYQQFIDNKEFGNLTKKTIQSRIIRDL